MLVEDHVRHRVRAGIADRSAYEVSSAVGRIKLDAMESPYTWPPELEAKRLSTLRGIELNRYPDPTAIKL